MILAAILFILLSDGGLCVIYHLNDTQYHRMPALYALDNYQSCVNQEGIYCVARLDLHGNSSNDVYKLIKDYSKYRPKHYNYTYIERGICVSKVCRSEINGRNMQNDGDLSEVLEECLNRTIWTEYKVEATLSQLYYCEKGNETTIMDIYDYIVIIILIVIILVNVFGSFYDFRLSQIQKTENNITGNKVLLNFSIIRNAKFLFSTQTSNKTMVQFKGLHGIRCIVQMGVVLCHAGLLIGGPFLENSRAFEKFYDNSLFYVIVNGNNVVQTFFVISGFLLAYQRLNTKRSDSSWKDEFKILLLRWCRMTPASMMMIAFTATLLKYLGSGPLWKLGIVNGTSANCRKYWWLHILYINNFVPDCRSCAFQTWSSAVDIQLLIIGLLLYRVTRPRNMNTSLLLAMLVAMVTMGIQLWITDLDGVLMGVPEFFRTISDADFDSIHVLPHSNWPSFAIGMITANLVYSYQKNGRCFSQYKLLKKISWFWIPTLMVMFVSGQMFYTEMESTPITLKILYGMTYRAAMGCLTACVIVILAFRLSDMTCTIFEWNGWVIFSRLSYCVFLVHPIFINILFGIRTQLGQVSLLYYAVLTFGILAISLIAAVVLNLFVEAPIYMCIKSLTSEEQQTKKTA